MTQLSSEFKNKELTICELHRQLYRLIMGHDIASAAVPLLEQAYAIGKKMDTKLRQYKNNYDDNWYEQNKSQSDSLAAEGVR